MREENCIWEVTAVWAVSLYFPCICEVLEYTSRSRSEAWTQDSVLWRKVATEFQGCGSIKVAGAEQTKVAQACSRARPCTPARPPHGTRTSGHLQALWCGSVRVVRL